MLVSIAVGFLLAALPQEADPDQVQRWVASLDSEDAKVREDAEARLLQAGRSIRPLLTSALTRLSPEQKGRVEAILQRFVVEDGEEFAIRTLRKGDPFPLPPPAPGVMGEPVGVESGMPLSDALSAIAKRFNLKIEFFPADTAFRREAERAQVGISATTYNGDAEYLLTTALTSALDGCYVVEKDRVVIVRLTPNVLLERLSLSDEWRLEIERRIDVFEGRTNRHDTTVGSFLQACYKRGGPRFALWSGILRSIALDPRRPVRARCDALKGMRWFRGLDREEQPDLTAVMIQLVSEEKTPPELRAAAGGSLAYCMEEVAQEKVLDLLERGEAALLPTLLDRLFERNHGYLSALHGIKKDPKRSERLVAALEKLERSSDPDVALRSLSVHSVFAKEGPVIQRLAKVPDPSDPQTLRVFLEALRIAAFSRVPEICDRVDRLAAQPSPRLRASAALIYGRSVGGTERTRDVQGALTLLQDKEPIVRWAAAEALYSIYKVPSAAEPYYDDWEASEARLKKALQGETDPQVRASLEKALARR